MLLRVYKPATNHTLKENHNQVYSREQQIVRSSAPTERFIAQLLPLWLSEQHDCKSQNTRTPAMKVSPRNGCKRRENNSNINEHVNVEWTHHQIKNHKPVSPEEGKLAPPRDETPYQLSIVERSALKLYAHKQQKQMQQVIFMHICAYTFIPTCPYTYVCKENY